MSQLFNEKLEEPQRIRALKFFWSEADSTILLKAEERCKEHRPSQAEHDPLSESVMRSELSHRRRDVRFAIQKALNASDLHVFVEALSQTQEVQSGEPDDLNSQLASLKGSKLLRLVSNEDRKLLRQHWDKHVSNAKIADLPVLKGVIPHSAFDSSQYDPWCPVTATAKVTEKVTQLEQREQTFKSAIAELTLATDLRSLRKAFYSADRVIASEKLSLNDLEQWQDEICQAVRTAICQADRASDLHDFRKDKQVWSFGDGKWWSEDLEKTWKCRVQECEQADKDKLEAAMNARRVAAEGQDYQALESAIAEAEKLGAEPDAFANLQLHNLKSGRWQWGWR